MKVSFYTTIWGLKERPNSFNMNEAFANWSVYADEISVACGDDYSLDYVERLANQEGYPVKAIRTSFDFISDGQAYGKTENAALQNCSGEILVQSNADERFRVNKNTLLYLGEQLLHNPTIGAFFVPTIDLYGSLDKYVSLNKKWYVHKPGYKRGPVNFGFKMDGRIDYSKSSTDELVDQYGNLVPTVDLLPNMTIESLREYVKRGMPISYHVGYVQFAERLDRSLWWKEYWSRTTGDENKHPTSIDEIAARETKVHGLPLWESVR